MKKVILGIGIPGSGKTTVLKKFAEKNGYAYISSDALREEITGNAPDQSKNIEVWSEAWKRTKNYLDNNNTVVFDATFSDLTKRKDFIAFAKENGAEKIEGIFIDIPVDIAKERNSQRDRVVPDHAIDKMKNSLDENKPSIDDGFDAIFTLDHEHNLVLSEMKKEDKVLRKEFISPR